MALASVSIADTVTTKDGSVLQGTVESVIDGKVTLKTAFAGVVTISLDQVAKMETSATMPVHLKDGSVIVGTLMPAEDGVKVKRAEDKTEIPASIGDIAAVNPPAKPPVKWTGSVVGSMLVTGGNTENTGFGLYADGVRRSDDDRITLRTGYFYSKNQSVRTRDDVFLSGKYDYFIGKKTYVYGTGRVDRDTIRALDLRTTLGAGLGYQFMETERMELSGEAGLSYVNEDYVLAVNDASYAAGRLGGKFGWWIIPKKLYFVENMEVFFGVQDVQDMLAVSDSSLIWKWTERWSTRATLRFDWDNTPATGRERLDSKLELGLGFTY